MTIVQRTARKELPCESCGGRITPGTVYDVVHSYRKHVGCERLKRRRPYRRYLCIGELANGRRVACRLYNSFDAMHKRCYSPSRWEYDMYGARGITVCAEWLHNYPAFRKWALANGYRKGLSIDRIDNSKGYSPDNCRWATREEQTYNSSRVHKLTLNGVTKLLPIWAQELGVPMETLRQRRSKGWPDEHILTVPKGGRCPGMAYQKPGRKPKGDARV